MRPGHHHATPNLYGQVQRPGHPGAPHRNLQEPIVYRDGRYPGHHDPRTVHTPGQMNSFSVTPEVITASPHDVMIQENKINQAIALVNKDKVPMPSGPNLLTVASNRKTELERILEQCQLNPNMYPLIPGHIMPIAERLSGHTFLSPFNMDGSINSLKHLRKFVRDEMESSIAAEKLTGRIDLSALGLTGVPIDVYDHQLKQFLRIVFRGSLRTVLSESLLQGLFIVVHTNGGSSAIAAQLIQDSFGKQTQQLLNDFSQLSIELHKYGQYTSKDEVYYVTDQQIQIIMDTVSTQMAPFLNLSVREALDKTRRLGKSPNLLSPAEFLHTLILGDNSPHPQAQRKFAVISAMEQKLAFMPSQLLQAEVDHRVAAYLLAQGTDYTKDDKSKWEWLTRILPAQFHEGVRMIRQQQLLQNGFLPEWSAIWKILTESLSEQSHQQQLSVNAVHAGQSFKPARDREPTPAFDVTGTTLSEWKLRGNRFDRRYEDGDHEQRGRHRPFDARRGRDTNPNRDARSGWRRSRSNARGDDHSRDSERKRPLSGDDKETRTLSKSPNRQLDQSDDGKRRDHSRSRSRERRPPSSERPANEEDKEEEERERAGRERFLVCARRRRCRPGRSAALRSRKSDRTRERQWGAASCEGFVVAVVILAARDVSMVG